MDAFWILVLLIAISGYFSLAEMGLASARRSAHTMEPDHFSPLLIWELFLP